MERESCRRGDEKKREKTFDDTVVCTSWVQSEQSRCVWPIVPGFYLFLFFSSHFGFNKCSFRSVEEMMPPWWARVLLGLLSLIPTSLSGEFELVYDHSTIINESFTCVQ